MKALKVFYYIIVLEPPKILPFSFGNEAVNEGERRQLLCTVIQGDEPLSIKWSMQGQDLGVGPDLITSQLGSHASILMLSSISYRHTGTYTCTVSNPAGAVAHSADLIVNGKYKVILRKALEIYIYFILEPPEILSFSFGNKAVNEGERRQLLCTVVSGDEPLSMKWSLQGQDLSPGPDLTTTQLGTHTSILMLSSVNYRHTGTYTCFVSNPAGMTSHSAELVVNGNWKIGLMEALEIYLLSRYFFYFRTTKYSSFYFWKFSCK